MLEHSLLQYQRLRQLAKALRLQNGGKTYQNKWTGNIIKEFDAQKLNLKKIAGHMFTDEHNIMKFGKTKDILNILINVIKIADHKNLLKNGLTNQIRTTIDGLQIEIRVHIIDGKLLNINAFDNYANRNLGNIIYI